MANEKAQARQTETHMFTHIGIPMLKLKPSFFIYTEKKR